MQNLALQQADQVLVGGLSEVALTKLDVLDDFDEIKVAIQYKNKITGEIINHYPTSVYEHKNYEAIYETHKGWKTDISKCKTYDELPLNAKKYLSRLEELLGIKISIISVGPDREQTIFR